MSYICGYFRHYYPVEYCTSYLNCAKNNDDIVNGTALINKYGIKIMPVKFGHSVWEYTCDSKTKTIYKGLDGIKYINNTVAEELYNLRNNNYASFVDVLVDINNKTTANSRQLGVLIKIDFFSDFGGAGKLLKVAEKFQNLYGKKIIQKKKIAELGISEELIREYANKESDAQYRFSPEGMMLLLKKYEANTANEQLPLKERLNCQQEYIGYIDFTDTNLDAKYIFVSNLDTKYSPRLTAYCLKNGKTCVLKAYKKMPRNIRVKTSFAQLPVEKGDILYMNKCEKRFKKRMNENGKWVNSDEMEWWLTYYRKVDDLKIAT